MEKIQFWTILVLEYHKTHFPRIYCLKKKDGNGKFFDNLNFLFLQPRKDFLRFRIYLKHFSWPILPKKKLWENGQVCTKAMD